MDINDFISSNVDNYDDIRDCTMTSNKNSSRMVSISSSKVSVDYATKIEQLNDDISEETVFKKLIDSLQLSYINEEEIQVSRVTDYENRACPQCDNSNVPALKSTLPQRVDDDVINTQLPYDPNTLMESKLWDRNFYPILLHRSLEYLAFDSENIKDLLNFIAKYVSNKQINLKRSNNIQDFKGMGKVIWNLISLVYQLNWDSLITDKNSYTL